MVDERSQFTHVSQALSKRQMLCTVRSSRTLFLDVWHCLLFRKIRCTPGTHQEEVTTAFYLSVRLERITVCAHASGEDAATQSVLALAGTRDRKSAVLNSFCRRVIEPQSYLLKVFDHTLRKVLLYTLQAL